MMLVIVQDQQRAKEHEVFSSDQTSKEFSRSPGYSRSNSGRVRLSFQGSRSLELPIFPTVRDRFRSEIASLTIPDDPDEERIYDEPRQEHANLQPLYRYPLRCSFGFSFCLIACGSFCR